LFASVCTSTHTLLQLNCPAVGQLQAPAVQLIPVGHTLPQAPQFFESVSRSTTTPLQTTPVTRLFSSVHVGVPSPVARSYPATAW
jgi:hypothetical protein